MGQLRRLVEIGRFNDEDAANRVLRFDEWPVDDFAAPDRQAASRLIEQLVTVDELSAFAQPANPVGIALQHLWSKVGIATALIEVGTANDE